MITSNITSIRVNITKSRSGHSTLVIRGYGTWKPNEEHRPMPYDTVLYKANKLNGPEQARNLAKLFKERKSADILEQFSDGPFKGFREVDA